MNQKMQRYLTITAVLAFVLYHGGVRADEALKLENETDRISYSLGQQIGKDLNKLGVDLDASTLTRGFNDASKGSESAMGREEMTAILSTLKGRIIATQREEAQELSARKQKEAEEKLRKGQKFLTENGANDGVKTLPSGLQYKVINSGTGKKPGPQDVVRVHYRARQLNGHEFGSSYGNEGPVSFRVNNVIPGWTEALQLMQEGAKWELYLPPELAYGRRGPLANQTVICEIELLSVSEDNQPTGVQTVTSGKTQ